MKSAAFDSKLGGRDMDWAIAQHAADEFQAKTGNVRPTTQKQKHHLYYHTPNACQNVCLTNALAAAGGGEEGLLDGVSTALFCSLLELFFRRLSDDPLIVKVYK